MSIEFHPRTPQQKGITHRFAGVDVPPIALFCDIIPTRPHLKKCQGRRQNGLGNGAQEHVCEASLEVFARNHCDFSIDRFAQQIVLLVGAALWEGNVSRIWQFTDFLLSSFS